MFLTQDATPIGDGWLERLVAPLDATARVGLSFGPHLPRPGTSPMIARELTQFFATFGMDGVRLDDEVRPGDAASGFFSNVNSAVLRECWEAIRFRDVAYAEDQAFARDAMAAGWRKAFVPDAGVLHAHDYPWREFMRRYFDEYRGLRETTGHIERLRPSHVAAQVRADARHMRASGLSGPQTLAWTGRSLRHHAGRAVFASLGSRADRLSPRSDAVCRSRSAIRRPLPGATIPYAWVRPHFTEPAAALGPPSPIDETRGRCTSRGSCHRFGAAAVAT